MGHLVPRFLLLFGDVLVHPPHGLIPVVIIDLLLCERLHPHGEQVLREPGWFWVFYQLLAFDPVFAHLLAPSDALASEVILGDKMT